MIVYAENPRPFWPNWSTFVPIHNLILSIGSLIIFLGCLCEVVLRCRREGSVEWLLCEHESQEPTEALFFWSYIYYLSKFYELLDTFLQLARGKYPPNYLLHSYHHAGVIFMCWIWIETAATMQFIGLLFNTAVHVVMYRYFYLKSIEIEPTWKRHVTTFQIVQFVTSLVCFVITVILHHYYDGKCKSMNSVYGSIVFNITLLYGFLNLEKRKKKMK
jgi:GNS1/SUR4 family